MIICLSLSSTSRNEYLEAAEDDEELEKESMEGESVEGSPDMSMDKSGSSRDLLGGGVGSDKPGVGMNTTGVGKRQWGSSLTKRSTPRRKQQQVVAQQDEQQGKQQEQEQQKLQQQEWRKAEQRVLSLSDLRAIAERKGLDLQKLLDDAKAKGVSIET